MGYRILAKAIDRRTYEEWDGIVYPTKESAEMMLKHDKIIKRSRGKPFFNKFKIAKLRLSRLQMENQKSYPSSYSQQIANIFK